MRAALSSEQAPAPRAPIGLRAHEPRNAPRLACLARYTLRHFGVRPARKKRKPDDAAGGGVDIAFDVLERSERGRLEVGDARLYHRLPDRQLRRLRAACGRQRLKRRQSRLDQQLDPITDLFDLDKTNKLIEEIESSGLSKEEKNFLKLAAYRHTVFDYENIAEFYAQSDKAIQDLMEKSALIIIDFNKAIENGFVKLTKDLADLSAKES